MPSPTLPSGTATPVRNILALDLGIGSYGIAVQHREVKQQETIYSFPVVRSCTLPADWAGLAEERTRRRMYRTRLAHRARESWLRSVFRNAGLGGAVLEGRKVDRPADSTGVARFKLVEKGDFRLEREFPPQLGEKVRDDAPNDAEGARTVYCGSALRCLLLLGRDAQIAAQGAPLAPWQVFKALHSAIQKRGYDPKVPWSRQSQKPQIDPSSGDGGGKVKRSKSKNSEKAEASDDAMTEDEKAEQKEEQASLERALTMQGIIEGLIDDPQFHRPCFWEAWRLGLWIPSDPTVVQARLNHSAKSCKWADQEDPANRFKPANERDPFAKLPAIFPRAMVEAELIALCEAAADCLPALAGSAYEIAFGPVGVPYPTIPRKDSADSEVENRRREGLEALPPEQRRKFVRGKEAEWQGALAQKAPTFDNRGPGPCALIPRFKVAKCDLRQFEGSIVPDSLLPAEVSFLLQLKNFRFAPEVPDQNRDGGLRDALNADELKKLHADHFTETVVPRLFQGMKGSALTKKVLCDWLGANVAPKRTPKPGQEGKGKDIIEMPKTTGRSRFSRPGLKLVKALVLSGLAPADFKKELMDVANPKWASLRQAVQLIGKDGVSLNHDEKCGIVPSDLDFLDRVGTSWEKISIRDERLEALSDLSQAEKDARQRAITQMIAGEINPKIRHRLTLLDRLLDEVTAEAGMPDRVVIEFAREEWMGPKRRKELMDFQNQRRQENITTRLKMGENASPRGVLKHQLLSEQRGMCLFCGGQFSSPEVTSVANGQLSFENAHLAHIVPDSKGGPRAYLNLVLACAGCNTRQGDLYHGDAFAKKVFPGDWDAFLQRVNGCNEMRPFKKKILTTRSADEAAEMVQNRTSLQETAWIAKLARVLISLKFGWRLDSAGEERRVVVVTGSVTNRVASKYGLYSLLGGEDRIRRLADQKAEIEAMMDRLDEAEDADIDLIGDECLKKWKFKKRKGDDTWDRDHLLWLLRRNHIANEDAINEKDRDDDRHHALDAMVLSFLPHWAGNPGKSLYFGLPPGRDWKTEFQPYLDNLYPEVLISERPELEDSFYGARRVGLNAAATKRYLLREIAYSGLPAKFSESTLAKRAANIFDPPIRAAVLAFVRSKPKEPDWIAFCEKLNREGVRIGGPGISKVRCLVSADLTEYGDFSKDSTGAFRRGDKNQGWFVCERKDKPGKFAIEPVYVHRSRMEREKSLLAEGNYLRVVNYFVRDEIVSISRSISGIKDPLPAGNFSLRSMRIDGYIKLSNNAGHTYLPVHIDKLMEHGFEKPMPKT